MEIERKFLIKQLPDDLGQFSKKEIEQAYLCMTPVIRVRRENDNYYMTYKGKGLMVREEYNLPLTQEGYTHLLAKADGRIITKTRYLIPEKGNLTIELDIFHGELAPLVLAEVEFASVDEANAYRMPDWFDKDVTNDPAYHNSNMSMSQKEKP